MIRRNWSVVARVLGATVAVVALGACATKSDIRDLRTELRALGLRQDSLLAQLRMQSLSTQDTIRTQSNQLFDFRGEITRQLRQISQSLSTLEAVAGENQRGISGIRDQLANLRRTEPAARPVAVSDSLPGNGDESVAGSSGNPDQLYRTAMDQYGRGSLNTARMAFEQFVSVFPNHDLSPDAHFFLADVLYQSDDLDGALGAFGEIPARFPDAPRVPQALYRIALIQLEQDETEDAIATLERIVNSYSDSDAAGLARDKLDEING